MLWLHEAKIDMRKRGLAIYSDFVLFCKGSDNDEFFYNSDFKVESSESSSSKLKKKVKKLERTVGWIGNYIENQTGIEPGKELADSSDLDYALYKVSINPKKKIYKVKKKSSNKVVKPKRNSIRVVQFN